MLVGTYASILSPNRRTAIPKKFLKELGDKIIMAKWYEGCLVVVSEVSWLALLKRLTGGERIPTEPVRDTERFILGSAYELASDFQGRVTVPQELADYAHLTTKLIFIGLIDRVEVWDESVWREKEKDISARASQIIEKLANETKSRVS